MVVLADALSVPPFPSAVSAAQATRFPATKAPARVLERLAVEDAVTGAPSTVQAKVVMRLSPSASDAEAVQMRVSARVAPELGDSVTLTVGARLLSVRVAVPTSVPPSVSVAVAVQVMVSPLEAVVADRSRLLPVPRLPALLPDQA